MVALAVCWFNGALASADCLQQGDGNYAGRRYVRCARSATDWLKQLQRSCRPSHGQSGRVCAQDCRQWAAGRAEDQGDRTASTQREVARLLYDNFLKTVAFSPDGHALAVGGES